MNQQFSTRGFLLSFHFSSYFSPHGHPRRPTAHRTDTSQTDNAIDLLVMRFDSDYKASLHIKETFANGFVLRSVRCWMERRRNRELNWMMSFSLLLDSAFLS
jgi:hypothetical protein